jgi:hypothetical protein
MTALLKRLEVILIVALIGLCIDLRLQNPGKEVQINQTFVQ